MLELVFCTNNDHKIKEVSQIMGTQFSFLRLKDVQFFDDIPEPFETIILLVKIVLQKTLACL
jgi:XTP/dITP diphosphohydrolase